MTPHRHHAVFFARLLRLLAVFAVLAAVAPAAASVPAAPQGAAPAQTGGRGTLAASSAGRVLLLPIVRQTSPQPPPPPAISASLTLRPVPQDRVQRGRTLSVEYRYTNTGAAQIGSAGVSLFYPQRLISFQNVSLPAGDSLTNYDGSRVNVRLVNVAVGETRTGRINFLVNRNAGEGERIGLFADFTCQPGAVPCRSNFAEVEVIRNDDEGTGSGGTFNMTVSPDQGPPGTVMTFSGSFFAPGERIITWMNTSTGAYPLPVTTTADANGNIRIIYGTSGLVPGYYSLVAHGQRSSTEGVGAFIITQPGRTALAGLEAAAVAAALPGFGVALPGAAEPAAAPAQASATGSGGVAGRVVDGAGAGVAGVQVEVRDATGALAATAVTRADGVFFVASGLASGSYTVTAAPSRGSPAERLQFLGDVSSGAVVVAEPEITRGVNLTLPAAGALAGVATAPGGAPRPGVRVSLEGGDGVAVAATVTDDQGAYRIGSVAPGAYTVVLDPRGATDGGSLAVRRAAVTIVAGQVTTDTAPLRASATTGELSGRVTDGAGAGVPDVAVVITERTSGVLTVANTDAQGAYSSGPLAPGSYSVQFLPGVSEEARTAGLGGEYYNDAATFAAATPVTVTAGQLAGNINAALTPGASIAGRVSGADGAGLADVTVVAYDPEGRGAAVARSDETGAYTLRGLAAGSYVVQFITTLSPSAATRAYSGAFYDTTPPTAPTLVTLAAGQAATGVDQALAQGVQVVGTVTAGDTGEGLAGVGVLIFDVATGLPAAAAVTDADGRYATGSLSSGQYKARFTTIFSPNPAARTYVDEFFSNQPTYEAATTFTLGRLIGTRQINAELARGGAISGRVSAADSGAGLAGVVVVARQGSVLAGAVTTDAGGRYVIPGLAAGAYTVSFVTDASPDPLTRRYAGEVYDDAAPSGAGTPVTVVLADETEGVDATLALRP